MFASPPLGSPDFDPAHLMTARAMRLQNLREPYRLSRPNGFGQIQSDAKARDKPEKTTADHRTQVLQHQNSKRTGIQHTAWR